MLAVIAVAAKCKMQIAGKMAICCKIKLAKRKMPLRFWLGDVTSLAQLIKVANLIQLLIVLNSILNQLRLMKN